MCFLRFTRHVAGWTTLLLVGFSAACAALIAAICVLKVFFPGELAPRFMTFVVASCLIAALLGPALWWWAIIKPDRLSTRRGIGVGALGGILVHPLVLYTLFVEAYLTRQSTALPVGNPTNPLLDLVSALLGGIMSVLFAGWITVPIGAMAGWIIALLQSRSGSQERWRAALAE
jgi:hypothetical protein